MCRQTALCAADHAQYVLGNQRYPVVVKCALNIIIVFKLVIFFPLKAKMVSAPMTPGHALLTDWCVLQVKLKCGGRK